MPIDADAYMAGAIPTLSRGGSWLPPDAARVPYTRSQRSQSQHREKARQDHQEFQAAHRPNRSSRSHPPHSFQPRESSRGTPLCAAGWGPLGSQVGMATDSRLWPLTTAPSSRFAPFSPFSPLGQMNQVLPPLSGGSNGVPQQMEQLQQVRQMSPSSQVPVSPVFALRQQPPPTLRAGQPPLQRDSGRCPGLACPPGPVMAGRARDIPGPIPGPISGATGRQYCTQSKVKMNTAERPARDEGHE
jgi:hypothetical protein